MMKTLMLVMLTLVCSVLLQVSLSAETLLIPATTPDGVLSSPLQAGVTYVLTASGTATNGYEISSQFDAEWQTRPNTSTWEEYYSADDFPTGGPWTEQRDILDVFINNEAVDWLGSPDGLNWSAHTFSPSHVYKFYFVGTGSTVKFHIADAIPILPDNWYADNSGFLTIYITPIPEPASLLALAGGLGMIGGMARRRKR